MFMIDIVAPEGTFPSSSEAALLARATACLLEWGTTSGAGLAVADVGAYLHVIPRTRVAVGGKAADLVRVELLESAGTLGQEQRIGITEGVATLVAELASDSSIRERTWVIFREAGLAGHGYLNAGLAREASASLNGRQPGSLLRRLWQALEVASS
jgi:hypothetical protein